MTHPDPTAIQTAAIAYSEKGFGVIPAFSPAMIAAKDQLDLIRNSPHLLAHLFYYLLMRLCKIPLRNRFHLFPICDPQKAAVHFGRYPNANILISTGRRSGLVILDIDDAKYTSYTPNTRSVLTGHGEHFYFRYPEGFRCTRKITPQYNDILGDTGCAIVPPSEHGSGKYYTWKNPNLLIAPLPDELRGARNAFIQHKPLILLIHSVRNTMFGLLVYPLLKITAAPLARFLSKTGSQSHTATSPMTEAALEYLKQGFTILPAYSPAMFPATKARRLSYLIHKMPLRARFIFKPLRTAEEICNCFDRFPLANLLIITGARSGIAVLEVETQHTPVSSLHLPPTRTVTTPTGKQYYFLLASNLRMPTVKDAIAPGVTLMAEMGTVIAPPSLREDGKNYSWDNPDIAIAPLPEHLRKMLTEQTPKKYDLSFLADYFHKRFIAFPVWHIASRLERFILSKPLLKED